MYNVYTVNVLLNVKVVQSDIFKRGGERANFYVHVMRND